MSVQSDWSSCRSRGTTRPGHAHIRRAAAQFCTSSSYAVWVCGTQRANNSAAAAAAAAAGGRRAWGAAGERTTALKPRKQSLGARPRVVCQCALRRLESRTVAGHQERPCTLPPVESRRSSQSALSLDRALCPGAGYRVQGTGYRVPGTGCRVQSAGCRMQRRTLTGRGR